MASDDKNVRKLSYLIETVGLDKLIKQLEHNNKTIDNTKSTVDRANKSVGGFAKNSTSAFAKQSQGLGGLVHVYATVAANVFALSAAFLVLKQNADLQILRSSAEKLSASTGTNFLRVAENMKEISNGALTISDAMRQANLALASGLSTKQLEDITQVAVKAAAATGRSVEESVQRMVQAVVKGEPELVDEFGIILRVGKAVEDYALSHNKAASSLTTFERQQAIATQAIERGQKAYKDINLDEIVNPFQQLQVVLTELTHTFVSFISGPLKGLATFFKENEYLLIGIMALFAKNVAKNAIPSLQDFNRTFIESNRRSAASFAALSTKLQNRAEDIKDTYADVLQGNNKLANSFRILAKTTPGLKDTPLGQAAKGKASNKEIIEATLKTFEKDANKMVFEIDESLRNFIRTSVGNISKKHAIDIRTAISKKDYLEQLSTTDRVKEFFVARTKQYVAETKVFVTELQKRASKYRQFIAQALAEGAAAGLKGSKEVGKNLAEQAGGGLLGTVTKVSSRLGGFVSSAAAIGSSLLGWGIALSLVVGLVGPIANFLGIWNSELEESTDRLDEINDANTKILERFEKIDEFTKSNNVNYADGMRILRTQVDILGEMVKNLEQAQKVLRDMGKKNAFQRFWQGDNDVESVATTIKNTLNNYRKLGGKEFVIDINAEKVIETVETVAKFSEYGSEISEYVEETVKNLVKVSAAFNTAADIEKKYYEVRKRQGKNEADLFLEEALKGLLKQVEATRETKSKIETDFKAIDQSFTTLADSLRKKSSSIGDGGPFAEYVKQFEAIKINLEGLEIDKGGETLERFKEQLKSIPPIIRDMYNITDVKSFYAAVDDLFGLQKSYASLVNSIKSAEQELKNVRIASSRGSIAALEDEFALQGKIAALKAAQIAIEIENNRKLIENAKKPSSSVSQEAISALEINNNLLRLTLQSLLKEAGLLYNVQRLGIEKINKLTERRNLKLAEQTTLLQAQSELYSAIAKDSSRSNEERILAANRKASIDILNVTKSLSVTTKNIQDINAKISLLKAEQGDNTLEILKLEKERAILKKDEILSETKIRKIKQDALKDQLSIEREGFSRDIGILKDRLDILQKISNISQQISDDDRISASKRSAELIKSNKQLSKAFELEKQVSELKIQAAKQNIKTLEAAGELADPREIEKATLEIQMEQTIQLGLQAEERKRQLDYAEQLFDLQKKQTELNDFFTRPEETMQMIRTEFALSAAEFAEQMTNPVDRLVDSIEATIDNTVDAFVDAIVEGDNVLKATTDAIVNTLNEAALDYTKDILKKLSRDLIVKLTGDENYGKSAEEILLEQAAKKDDRRNELLQQIATCTANVASASAQTGTAIGSFGNLLQAAPGSREEFDLFDSVNFDDISAEGIKVVEQSQTAVQNMSSGVSTIISKLGSSFMDFGSQLTSMGMQVLQSLLFSSAGSVGSSAGGLIGSIFGSSGGLFSGIQSGPGVVFAEAGGIFNELKSIKAYANGGMTQGPELAMIGEGSNREAVVPLPDNRSIPVDLGEGKSGDNITINVNISNVQGTEQGLRRSASQIGMQVSRALQQANRRNG